MTYQDIQNANAQIKTTDIKGKEYAEVNQRIKAFRMCYPTGSIETIMIKNDMEDSGGIVTFKAIIKDEDGKVLGTGTAQEKETSSFINKTSYIENCETSAVGRALGMCGFGIDTSVASFEEVANAIENQGKKKETKGQKIPKTLEEAERVLAPEGTVSPNGHDFSNTELVLIESFEPENAKEIYNSIYKTTKDEAVKTAIKIIAAAAKGDKE